MYLFEGFNKLFTFSAITETSYNYHDLDKEMLYVFPSAGHLIGEEIQHIADTAAVCSIQFSVTTIFA